MIKDPSSEESDEGRLSSPVLERLGRDDPPPNITLIQQFIAGNDNQSNRKGL